jgi:homoserine kinase
MYQKYRKALYPASLGLAAELTDTYGIPAFISGSGPAVTAILDEEMFSDFKNIKGRITGEYLSFQSMTARISEEGSYYSSKSSASN